MRTLTMPNTHSTYRAFQNIINSTTHSFIVALDTDYNFLVSNDAHRKMFRDLFGKEVVIGKSMLYMLAEQPEALVKQKETWARALSGEEFMVLENHKAQTQEIRYYEVSYSPLHGKAGKIIGATAITRDVTEKIQRQLEITNLLVEKEKMCIDLERQNNVLAFQENQMRKLFNAKMKLYEDLERQNEELATQEEEIRQNNEHLSVTNNQLTEEREKLISTTKELEDRNFELDQILYRTSHDIRSPIASVLGLVGIAKEETNINQIYEYLTFIEKRMADLDRFTRSMLSYGKEQRSEVRIEAIDFENMVQHCWLDLQYIATFARLKKTIRVEKNYLTFYNDSFRLGIILSNILSNAVKYQNLHCEDSFVDVHILQNYDHAIITIRDNGIGVEQAYIDKIFDMFFRATDKNEGSGLGMYIVQQTVERLDGEISFESALGEGTTIIIRLPNELAV